MYYYCFVSYNKLEETYHIKGQLLNDDNKIIIQCKELAQICNFFFNEVNGIQLLPNFPQNIEEFIFLIQKRLNQYRTILSESFLQYNNTLLTSEYQNEKDIVYAVIDLNEKTFRMLHE